MDKIYEGDIEGVVVLDFLFEYLCRWWYCILFGEDENLRGSVCLRVEVS